MARCNHRSVLVCTLVLLTVVSGALVATPPPPVNADSFTYHLWVTVEPTGAGTVALSPAGTTCPTTPAGVTKCVTYATTSLPPNGQTVSFTATPASGYYFVAWALNGSYLSTGIPANNPDTWVMNASYALTAYFQAESYPMGQNQWVRYPENPVLTTSTNSWDSDVVYDSKPFLFPNGTFGMVYFGCCTGYGIGLAKSPDGRTWTKVSNVANGGPILLQGGLGQWDRTVVRPGSIFYDSSTSQYLLYYSGRTTYPKPSGVCGIGVAYSTDAITWTKSRYEPAHQYKCQFVPWVVKSLSHQSREYVHNVVRRIWCR